MWGVVCRNCIIDKNAKIGRNVVIANTDVRTKSPVIITEYAFCTSRNTHASFVVVQTIFEADRAEFGFHIRSGIVIVGKNSVIKDDTVI